MAVEQQRKIALQEADFYDSIEEKNVNKKRKIENIGLLGDQKVWYMIKRIC